MELGKAMVNCQYARMRGDLAWSLTIYTVEPDAPGQPSERDLSHRLSRELSTVTLFPAGVGIPGTRRLVTQDGAFHLARMEESWDEDLSEDEVVEVSVPVPELPHAAVARFEDVVLSLRLPSPIADRYASADRGHRQLREVRGDLVMWERLCVRIEEGWPPLGWYGAPMYRETLGRRDELEALIPELPQEDRADAGEALRQIDARFRELTVEDGGAALVEAGEVSAAEMTTRPWYWHRRPAVPPWDDTAD